jgi:hypothetical protein
MQFEVHIALIMEAVSPSEKLLKIAGCNIQEDYHLETFLLCDQNRSLFGQQKYYR